MAEKRKKKMGVGSARARERERLLEQAAATVLPERAEVCVLGGGAAGLACAIAAAEAGAAVVVLERDLECGRTILATGNGRCNFANTDLSAEHYNCPEFVSAVMGESEDALGRILGFFSECGLAWAEEDGRLYPRSRQAASVRNVLLARAERAGVTFACACEVVGAERAEAQVRDGVTTCTVAASDGVDEPDVFAAKDDPSSEVDSAAGMAADVQATRDAAVCNATGTDASACGVAGTGDRACGAVGVAAPSRDAVGADAPASWRVSFTEAWSGKAASLEADTLVFAGGGSAHALAGELGLSLITDEPVLCALSAQGPVPGMLEALDGRRAHCMASLTRGGRVVAREAGEALFRPYGISGIVSFDLSRYARPGDMLELDLAPEVDAWEVDKLVAARPGDAHALDGILDPTIAAELIKLAGGVNFGGLAWRVAPLVKGLPLRVTGKADEARAQVTRGGIDTASVEPASLAVLGTPALFACGEALDVDGACGGFNLAWAWDSGLRAGASAACLALEARERRLALEAEKSKLAAAERLEKAAASAHDEDASGGCPASGGNVNKRGLSSGCDSCEHTSRSVAACDADAAAFEPSTKAPTSPTSHPTKKGSPC